MTSRSVLVIEQKADDGVRSVAFQQMSFQLHAFAPSGVTSLGIHLDTVRLLVFDERPREGRIRGSRVCGIRRKILLDRDGAQLGAEGLGKMN